MEAFSCLLYLLFTGAFIYTLLSVKRPGKACTGKLPPGPATLPVVGNLLELGDKPHKSLAKLAKTYGPLMTLKLGGRTTIVASSAGAAKEILQKHDISFSNRTVPDSVRAHSHNEFSMVWLPVSPQWRTLRKICNSHVFTAQQLDAKQDLRRRKIDELLTYVEECCRRGVAVDIGRVAFNTSLNLLSNTFFSGDLVQFGSNTRKDFKELVWGVMEEVGRPNLSDYFPMLSKLDLQGTRRRLEAYMKEIFEVFDHIIDRRLESRESNNNDSTNDVLGILLDIMVQKTEGIGRADINHLLLDLFAAGTDTTSSTIEWAMTELLKNPKILSKAQAELGEIIGKGNPVKESKLNSLLYLQAIVKETFRLHPAAPFLVPHKANMDTEILGFIVPKNAQVLVNAYAIGRDSTLWVDSDSFMPERFLGSEVDVKGRDFELIPFGAGRRICPGLPLAYRMIHLELASLIHNFDWEVKGDSLETSIDMDDKFGITVQKAKPLFAIPIHL